MNIAHWTQRSLKVLTMIALGSALAAATPIPLEGTKNTRDLGGMPVAGGTLRSGLLIRSGSFCFLTESDASTIADLKLRTVIDLRTTPEIEKDGKDRHTSEANNIWLPVSSYHGRGAESYRSVLNQNPKAVRTFFATLADPQAYPLVFHCSAGKDRTGVLTALLLDYLGTPRARIVDDYMQSVRNSNKLWVDREWIDEVFQAVDRVGGAARFLEIQGVLPEHLESIRKILVVTPSS